MTRQDSVPLPTDQSCRYACDTDPTLAPYCQGPEPVPICMRSTDQQWRQYACYYDLQKTTTVPIHLQSHRPDDCAVTLVIRAPTDRLNQPDRPKRPPQGGGV